MLSSSLSHIGVTNRDLALLIWMIPLSVFMLSRKSFRKSLSNVWDAFTKGSIAFSFAGMLLYVVAVVFGLRQLGIWDISNLRDTVLWLFGSAFVLFINLFKIMQGGYLADALRDNVKWLVLLEFIVNLYVFGFWIEFFLMPILVVLGLLMGLTSVRDEYENLNRVLTGVMTIFGVVVLGFTLVSIIRDPGSLFSIGNLVDFLVPILLVLAIIPYLFVLSILVLYDSIFRRINSNTTGPWLDLYAKLKTIITLHLNLPLLRAWSRKVAHVKMDSKRDIAGALEGLKGRGA